MNVLRVIITGLLILCCSSCKRKNEAVPGAAGTSTTFKHVFESYWQNMNSHYSYWDTDTVNWDNIYKKYAPVFDKLDINNYDDNIKAAACFKQITANLIDCHYTITFQNNALQNTVINPAMDRKMKSAGFHYPYSFLKVDTGYLDKGYQVGYYKDPNSPNDDFYIAWGFIKKDILYFNCDKFHLLKCNNATGDKGSAPAVLKSFLSVLNNMQANIKGVIIDIRENGGGDIADLNFLAGRLTDQPVVFGKTRYKNGIGRLDYTPWANAVISPQPVNNFKQRRVIVLADNFSASLSEAFAMAVHNMPGGLVIGETTFGATGPVSDETGFNGGPFTVDSFLSVTEASARFLYTDGKSYENTGFPPDIEMAFDAARLNTNVDKQLEKAIEVLNQ